MSALKTSQIHDGFATIRSRGLQRSRSRAEQLERLKPMSMKSDSMPLYENPSELGANNNNNVYEAMENDQQLVYKFDSFPCLDTAPVSNIMRQETNILKNADLLSVNKKRVMSSCTSFKSNSNTSSSDLLGCNENDDKTSLPPPSPCHDIGLHAPQSPDSIHSSSGDCFLYFRPTSPLYERYIGSGIINRTTMSSSPETSISNEQFGTSSPPKLFTTSYYRKNNDSSEYALQKVTKKPLSNIKSHSLKYRNSMCASLPGNVDAHKNINVSRKSQSIYETLGPKYDRNSVHNYYNPSTNYYDPTEIGYATYNVGKQNAGSSQLLNSDLSTNAITGKVGFERRFATLAHPRDAQRFQTQNLQREQLQRKYMNNAISMSQTDVDYLDPLDCKIGCQTTLRSKPQIPWYELAIRKENRRQSCPQFQVNYPFLFSHSLCLVTIVFDRSILNIYTSIIPRLRSCDSEQ